MTTDYRVQLEAFDGPLDLLLYLIRRAEVDITDIPIASITDQYVEYLRAIERIDIELAGEFLLMAATLMEIKSRTLMPANEPRPSGRGPADDPAADPRADLVRQLLAYKKFRDAAGALEHRLEDWQRRFPTARALTEDPEVRSALALIEENPDAESTGAVDVDDLLLQDLAEAFHKIAESVNFDRLGDHQVADDDTPIELHAEDLLNLLRAASGGTGVPPVSGSPQPSAPSTQHSPVTLQSIFRGRTRPEMIGLFLATLELVRRREIFLRQDTALGQIIIGLREPEDAAPPPEIVVTPAATNSSAPEGPTTVAGGEANEVSATPGSDS